MGAFRTFRGQLSKCCSYPNGPPGGAARATTAQVASHSAALMATLATGADGDNPVSSLGWMPTHREEDVDHHQPFSTGPYNNKIGVYSSLWYSPIQTLTGGRKR